MKSVKELRSLLCMTQKEFAVYTGIPLATVQHWECGFRNPPKYVEVLLNRLVEAEHPEVESYDET